MDSLSTQQLAQACRIFLDVAYPGGLGTIPVNRRPYYDIPLDRPLADFVLPAPRAQGICQEMPRRNGAFHGYAFRLGSAGYLHLKLRVQLIQHHDQELWVYSVDTHDGVLQVTRGSTPEEAEQWKLMVEQNRQMKHDIEEALSLAGYLTPRDLLQLDLPARA